MGGRMGIESFEQLEVWPGAHKPVLHVYEITLTAPSDEKFSLISPMRRASVSVPANIAEGFKPRTGPDKIRFYTMAQGSLEELRYYFILGRDLGHKVEYDFVTEQADRVSQMLTGDIRSVRV